MDQMWGNGGGESRENHKYSSLNICQATLFVLTFSLLKDLKYKVILSQNILEKRLFYI